MAPHLKYLTAYPDTVQHQVLALIENKKLGDFLKQRHADTHSISNDRALREYVMALKNRYMKSSPPLSKIMYDGKIHVIHNALGTHSYVTRIQGSKLKSKNEIRVSSIFKNAPAAFLNMIVVHELAHLKEKAHNKGFYQLCEHMLPEYHQLEFEMRLYLTHLETEGIAQLT